MVSFCVDKGFHELFAPGSARRQRVYVSALQDQNVCQGSTVQPTTCVLPRLSRVSIIPPHRTDPPGRHTERACANKQPTLTQRKDRREERGSREGAETFYVVQKRANVLQLETQYRRSLFYEATFHLEPHLFPPRAATAAARSILYLWVFLQRCLSGMRIARGNGEREVGPTKNKMRPNQEWPRGSGGGDSGGRRVYYHACHLSTARATWLLVIS